MKLAGLQLLELKIHRDDRGYFVERYKTDWSDSYGLPKFVQDNHSLSHPGVVRGLHYQSAPAAQGKLIGVVRGRIWDVVVDIRATSPTFGQWEAVELSADDGRLLWIPAGFAHGFCVLGSEEADVTYKVDQQYHAATEGGLRWNDADLNIDWPVAQMIGEPLVSIKDQALPTFSSYRENPVF